ncbi:MAG: hypothetical protein M1816_004042 [Peltula sp. TS41687]|nr:MAG: hypothetical protein M1816_004042 [Peltula sp. TS41687]
MKRRIHQTLLEASDETSGVREEYWITHPLFLSLAISDVIPDTDGHLPYWVLPTDDVRDHPGLAADPPTSQVENAAMVSAFLRCLRMSCAVGFLPGSSELLQTSLPGAQWRATDRPELEACSASPAVKIIYLHQDDMPGFVQKHVLDLFDQMCSHLQGSTDAPGFLAYREQLHSNRDGAGTAFTTSFTRANNLLVAPVAHSSQTDDDSTVPRRAWLQRFNALVGDLAEELYRALLAPEYCTMLETSPLQ